MADIVEYLDLGATVIGDAQIEWRHDDDAVTPGTWATTTGTPTRFRLVLTERSTGAVVTLDTSGGAYTFSAAGGAANFSWSAGVLTIDLGGVAITAIPAGTYDAALWWYDAVNTNGLRWGHQQVVWIVQ